MPNNDDDDDESAVGKSQIVLPVTHHISAMVQDTVAVI